jgi:hypothetical protein
MPVGIVAGEKGIRPPGRTEKGAADAAEGEGTGRIGLRRRSGVERAFELADPLAQRRVGEVQQPSDLLSRMARQGEECGKTKAGRKARQRGVAFCGLATS